MDVFSGRSRRRVHRRVAALVVLLGLSGCGTGAVEDAVVESYGPHPLQRGQWYLPSEGVVPLVVLVHGGCYSGAYDRHLQDRLAARLVSEGFGVWNLDYRPPGLAPYPATFQDVTLALDSLPGSVHRTRVDLSRVALVGHSAGGHLVLWAGSDAPGPPSPPRFRPALVLAQSPLSDLALAHERGVCGSGVSDLLGGSPAQVPDRYRRVDPSALSPSVPTLVLHGEGDDLVPVELSRRYVASPSAAAAGVRLVEVPGDHFAHLDPSSSAVDQLVEELSVLR